MPVVQFFGEERREDLRDIEKQVDCFVVDVPWGILFARAGGVLRSDKVTEADVDAICEGIERYLKPTGKLLRNYLRQLP